LDDALRKRFRVIWQNWVAKVSTCHEPCLLAKINIARVSVAHYMVSEDHY